MKKALAKASAFLARRTGFEPAAYRIGICRSIQLRYRRMSGLLPLFLFSKCSFESFCELIGAGCASAVAVCTFEASDDVLRLHTLNELTDALGVAVATADELAGFDDAVVEGHLDLAGAGAFGCVFNVFFHIFDRSFDVIDGNFCSVTYYTIEWCDFRLFFEKNSCLCNMHKIIRAKMNIFYIEISKNF